MPQDNNNNAEVARWYVAHTYSGYENKVKDTLERAVENRGMQHLVQEVVDIGSYMFTDDRAYHFYATPPNEKKHTIPET